MATETFTDLFGSVDYSSPVSMNQRFEALFPGDFQFVSGTPSVGTYRDTVTGNQLLFFGTLAYLPDNNIVGGSLLTGVRLLTPGNQLIAEAVDFPVFEGRVAALAQSLLPISVLLTDQALPVASYGSSAADLMDGNGGNDTVDGGGGNDTLIGGAGADNVSGGEGDDRIVSEHGDGTDTYTGGNGFDSLDFSAVNGVVQVNQLAGTTTGSAGNDTLLDVFEQVVGTAFGDALSGGHGINILDGMDGNDSLYGNNGDDLLRGGEGDDAFFFTTSDGDDRLLGGNGFDVLDYSSLDGVVQVNQLAGTASGTAGNDTLLDIFEMVLGTAFGDVLSGGNGINSLQGNAGNDTIFGNGGDDYVRGGTGSDTITFGAGNDTIDFRNGDGVDVITDFVAGAGSDDTITLRFYTGLGADTLAGIQIQGRIVQSGADTEITLEGGDRITLQNVIAANLHADDFLFV